MEGILEERLRGKGYRHIAGVDEAGRGPLAGPVVAAAVILSTPHLLPGLDDSKRLTPKKRTELFHLIKAGAISWGVGIVPPPQIDATNILQATLLAMEKAVQRLRIRPDYLLIDGLVPINSPLPQSAIRHGDRICPAIAAASIVAKVIRDKIMEAIDRLYPQYGFSKNKGYGTRWHLEALRNYGPCPWHRRTFRGVADWENDWSLGPG